MARRFLLTLAPLLLIALGCSSTPSSPASSSGGLPTGGTGNVATNTTGGIGSGCEAGQTSCAGSCVSLLSNSANCGACGNACPAGTACAGGACACQVGLVACGSACVDTNQDSANCGACGNTCAATQSCAAGACLCPTGFLDCGTGCLNGQLDAGNCGSCGNLCSTGQLCTTGACSCQAGRSACGAACVDLTADGANCGVCGNACPAGQRCSNSLCTSEACPTGTTECNGGCVDLTSSVDHCGACGMACAGGLLCSSGSCGCPAGQQDCGGGCVDTSVDLLNCGACGTACASGQVCAGSACVCPNGSELCADACTDTLTNASHCGACGNQCPGGQSCSGGSCVCATAGQTFCAAASTCVNTETDPANCGACASQCATGQTCSAGSCSGGQVACDTPVSTTYQAEAMLATTGASDGAGGWVLWSAGGVSTEHPFQNGNVTLTVVAHGQQAGGVWPNMVVSVDGAPVGSTSVTSSSYTSYQFSFSAVAGNQELSIEFDNDYYDAATGDDRNLYVDSVTVEDCSDAGTATSAATTSSSSTTSTGGATSTAVSSVTNSTTSTVTNTATSTTGVQCPGGQTECAGVCVNTGTDAANCGACGNTCQSPQTCVNGSCQGQTGSCESAVASYQAVVTGSGSSWTVTRGTASTNYSSMRAAMQAAVDGLTAGRTTKQAVLVQGSGTISAGERVSLPSYTILNVCGTINVTGSGSGDMAPVYARGQRDIDVPNLTLTGAPLYGMFFRNVNNLHLGNIDMRLSGGLGIRVDNHGGDRTIKATNLTIDNVYMEGVRNQGVETYGIDGITIGTVVARDTAYCALLLNDSINAQIGLVDSVDAGLGTGYAAFRTANRNGRIGNSYPANIHVDQVIARGGDRGIFCLSESGGLVIDRVDISGTASNSILLENCYNVNIAAVSGTVNGRDVRIAARAEFANSSDITLQNLTLTNSSLIENPCAVNSTFSNNTFVNSPQSICN